MNDEWVCTCYWPGVTPCTHPTREKRCDFGCLILFFLLGRGKGKGPFVNGKEPVGSSLFYTYLLGVYSCKEVVNETLKRQGLVGGSYALVGVPELLQPLLFWEEQNNLLYNVRTSTTRSLLKNNGLTETFSMVNQNKTFLFVSLLVLGIWYSIEKPTGKTVKLSSSLSAY